MRRPSTKKTLGSESEEQVCKLSKLNHHRSWWLVPVVEVEPDRVGHRLGVEVEVPPLQSLPVHPGRGVQEQVVDCGFGWSWEGGR